jgi:hypothetical protein
MATKAERLAGLFDQAKALDTEIQRVSDEVAALPRDFDEAFLNLVKLIDDVQDPELRGRLIKAVDWYEHQRTQIGRQMTQLMEAKDALHEEMLAHHKARGDRGERLEKHLTAHVDGVLGRARRRWLGQESEPDHGALAESAVADAMRKAFAGAR